MKSNAPFLVASTAVSVVPCPEIIINGSSGAISFAFSSSSKPSSLGILMSAKTAS